MNALGSKHCGMHRVRVLAKMPFQGRQFLGKPISYNQRYLINLKVYNIFVVVPAIASDF
ncbi:hypothetical protein [Noviherbaspirillum sp.]|uniref:hypothetical protein n=1 Tax=Noviherbaspirillum sp. TaxID=1926288 RepID=UPI002FE03510